MRPGRSPPRAASARPGLSRRSPASERARPGGPLASSPRGGPPGSRPLPLPLQGRPLETRRPHPAHPGRSVPGPHRCPLHNCGRWPGFPGLRARAAAAFQRGGDTSTWHSSPGEGALDVESRTRPSIHLSTITGVTPLSPFPKAHGGDERHIREGPTGLGFTHLRGK